MSFVCCHNHLCSPWGWWRFNDSLFQELLNFLLDEQFICCRVPTRFCSDWFAIWWEVFEEWRGLNVSSRYTTNWKSGSVSLKGDEYLWVLIQKVMSKNNISTQMWQEREFDIFIFSIFVFHWHAAETFSFLTQCSRSHVDQSCWGCDLPLIFGWNFCTNITLRTTSVNKSR